MTPPQHRILTQNGRTFLATTHRGAVCLVPISPDTARRYLDMHAILPEDLHLWSDDALDDLVDDFDIEHTDACERTLFLLAHVGSRRASTLIWELARDLPQDLLPFAELAFAESLAWIRLEYLRDTPDARPTIRPV